MAQITIYDTTLRDGSQAEELSLTCEDKVRLACHLDKLGIHYIEGGWPASNQRDKKFFRDITAHELKNARIAAFGSTCQVGCTPEKDTNLLELIASKAPVFTVFGKTWEVHVKEALATTLDNNLELIFSSLAMLRQHCAELFFDAEHFFDGYKASPPYALACLKKAAEAGADLLVLCDTNGGTMPEEIRKIAGDVATKFPDMPLGIHAHNDCELAVANTIAAVQCGITQVQGTINGYGERCGNANLCSIIPCLQLKMGYSCLPDDQLSLLTQTGLFVAEIANVRAFHRQPFIGRSAFAHKGGVHVSAVRKNASTYEHINPERVGNKQRIILSDLAGQSNILFKARQFGFQLDKGDPFVLELLAELKKREAEGYEYAAAEASFELLLNRSLGRARNYFSLLAFHVLDRKQDGEPVTEAMLKVKVGGIIEHTAAEGDGPVNALDNALRKALEKFYPNLKEMKLMDFKVRVLPSFTKGGFSGTASKVRVLVESGDARNRWTTVGVSVNIIEASWQGLEDSINYKLFKDDQEKLTRAIREI